MQRRRCALENYLYKAERAKHPDYDIIDIFGISFFEKVCRVFKRA